MTKMNRTTFATRVFFLSFFSFLTVLLGGVLLGTLDAVRETVEAFEGGSPVVCFAVAEFYWALCAWYCARLVLEKRFAPFEPLLPCSSPKFAAWIVTWTPRLVGFLATVPLAVSFGFPNGTALPWWLRLLPSVIGLSFLGFVVFRRRLFGDLVHYAADPPGSGYAYPRFDRINRRGWALLIVLAAVPVIAFIALTFGPRVMSRWLGTPAIVLFAFGSWNLSAGFALIYLPLSRRRAALTAYPLLLALVFSFWMENHNTPIGPPPSAADAIQIDRRPSMRTQWQTWLSALDAGECRGGPVYLVAAAGGASRAAFWTARVLTTLEQTARDEAARQGRPPCFVRNIFAISGVSGGSLGAATVVSLLADEQVRGARWPDLPATVQAFLEQDMLAPVAGYFLFQDLVQRFVPVSVSHWDRSRGLERTWQADWRDLEAGWPAGAAARPPNWFNRPLNAIYQDGRDRTLPSLLLNTTRVADGRRALQSNVRFAPDDMYDLFAEGFLTANLTLAGAVHNSARFMYVSPAGRAWKLAGGVPTSWGYLVDGGYFENSGAATLAQLIREIPQDQRDRLTLLLISNDPSDGWLDYICAAGPNVPALKEPPISSLAMELIAPPFALAATRAARAHAADISAARMLGDDHLGHVFELRVPKVLDHVPPMTWFVSQQVGQDIAGFIAHPQQADGGRLTANLDALRALIASGSARPSSPCQAFMGAAPTVASGGR